MAMSQIPDVNRELAEEVHGLAVVMRDFRALLGVDACQVRDKGIENSTQRS